MTQAYITETRRNLEHNLRYVVGFAFCGHCDKSMKVQAPSKKHFKTSFIDVPVYCSEECCGAEETND